jgi:Trypsin-like peptidase domain
MTICESAMIRTIFVLALSLTIPTGKAKAEWASGACIKQYYKQPPTLGIDRSEASNLIDRVARSIGLTLKIVVIPCVFAEKAFSTQIQEAKPEIPPGQYIVYNPIWVREVIGNDQVQAIALFGHELGHLFNQDFTLNANLSPVEKETRADHFAGCAVARLNGDWSALESLFSRLRNENKDQFYPDRLTSLEAAKAGFEECGKGIGSEVQASHWSREQLLDSLVEISIDQGGESHEGTGFIVTDFDDHSVVITSSNNLGVSASESSLACVPLPKGISLKRRFSSFNLEGWCVRHIGYGISVIQLGGFIDVEKRSAGWQSLKLAACKVSPGDVVNVGYIRGYSPVSAKGTIDGLDNSGLIRTDIFPRKGMNGAPLVSESGYVVGIQSSDSEASFFSSMIPLWRVRPQLEAVIGPFEQTCPRVTKSDR